MVARFDKRDPFNLAAMHLVDESKMFGGRMEMDATTVARGSLSLISVNQLAQALRVMDVGSRATFTYRISMAVTRVAWTGAATSCPTPAGNTLGFSRAA